MAIFLVGFPRLQWTHGLRCLRPDFCLVHESVAARFLELLKQRVQRFYGADAQQSRQAAGTRVAS